MTVNSWGSLDPAEVAAGGSGRASHTAYGVICGGTTTTAAQQSIAGVGSANQVLTSNGAGALPTMQAAGGAGALVFLNAQTASSSSSIEWDSTYITTTYDHYIVYIRDMNPATDGTDLYLRLSDDDGVSFESTNYDASYYRADSNTENTTTADFRIMDNIGTTGNEGHCSGWIHIYNPEPSGSFTAAQCYTAFLDAADINIAFWGVGQYEVASTIDAIQFVMSADAIADGEFVLYGVKES